MGEEEKRREGRGVNGRGREKKGREVRKGREKGKCNIGFTFSS